MPYQCRDCSYKGNTVFPGGCCPACGSFDISGGAIKLEERQKAKSSTLRLVCMVVVWAYLIILIYQKLSAA